jgi:anti-sigma factor RsiW
MSCDDRAAFIVGDLAPERRAAFEAHLATCTACQQGVAAAKADEAALREWAKAPAAPPFAAAKLVQRAKTPRPARPGPLGVVVAAALALGVATVLFKPGAPETMVLEAEGTVAVFGDSVVVEPGSRADVTRSADETRVRLARGGMKFQVAKRKPGQRFVVESGDVERSEERRVGKECRRLCRSRWSPYH